MWWVGLAAVLIAVGGCSGGDDDDVEGSTTTVELSDVEKLFRDGEPLAVVRGVAAHLESLGEGEGADADAAVCDEAVDALEAEGTPDELASVAAEVPDPEISEAAFEQQAAVSSVLAACRGDAPVTVPEAVSELNETNAAFDELLAEKGVSE